MGRLRRMTKLAAPMAAIVIVAAACAEPGQADPPASSAEDQEEAMLAFAQCVREEGIDMPDPQLVEGRGIRIERGQGGARFDDPAWAEAREACAEHLEGLTQRFTPEHRAEQQDRMLAFARCMRSRGVDMPDPDVSDGPRIGVDPFGDDVDLDDPDVQSALETCRDEAFDGQGPGGIMIGGR